VVSAQVPHFQVHRSGFALVLGYVFVVIGALIVLDGVTHRSSGGAVVVVLFGIAMIAAAVALGVRPSVAETAVGVVVDNPLRTTVVPWSQLTDADISDVLRVHAGDQVVRCFAVPRKGRPSARSSMTLGGPQPSATRPGVNSPNVIATRLTDLALRERIGHYDSEEVRTMWSIAGVAATIVAVVSVAAALILAYA